MKYVILEKNNSCSEEEYVPAEIRISKKSQGPGGVIAPHLVFPGVHNFTESRS